LLYSVVLNKGPQDWGPFSEVYSLSSLYKDKTMNISVQYADADHNSTIIHAQTTLSSGSKLEFRAINDGSRAWELSFRINNKFNPDLVILKKGEKIEAVRLLLQIWESFKKYPCYVVTDDHREVCVKLGFEVTKVTNNIAVMHWKP
jgi:hypothetical protein